jgi:hypothetical protein
MTTLILHDRTLAAAGARIVVTFVEVLASVTALDLAVRLWCVPIPYACLRHIDADVWIVRSL